MIMFCIFLAWRGVSTLIMLIYATIVIFHCIHKSVELVCLSSILSNLHYDVQNELHNCY